LAAHDPASALQAYRQLEQDPLKPLNNRAIAGDLYAPGSTFKLITAAAALESGDYTPDSQLDAPKQLDLPLSSNKLTNFGDSSCSTTGKMSLEDALTVSCNTAFGWLGMELGQSAIAKQAQAFGFGQDLSIPLYVSPSAFPTSLDQAQTALSAIGQLDVRVTPLQMAMVTAAIANGGRMMKPQLVRSEMDSQLRVLSKVQAEELGQPISPETADQLADMMFQVAQRGTGTRTQVPGVRVGAKTGTAETQENKPPNVWTVAYGESSGRTVVVAVVVEAGGSRGLSGTGGTVAAPMVKASLEAVFQ
jgi:peptidoglycan glycosyltransferase